MLNLTDYQQQFSSALNPTIANTQWLGTAPSQLFFNESSTIFGPATVLFSGSDVYALSLKDASQTLADYQKKWPHCSFQQSLQLSPQQLLQQQKLNIACVGSAFQLSVWQQLLNMNKLGLISYQAIANALGNPKAARAVANAVGANPIAIFIPCHRVIYSDGSLGGYHYGPELKQRILQAEAGQRWD